MAELYWLRRVGWRWVMLAVAVLAVLPLTIPFFVREAGLRAVDRRELSSGRRLLAEVQQPWLGSSAILVGARAALLDGDRELAEGMLQRAGVLSGARVDFEKTLLRFRSGDTGEAVSWLTAEQDALAAGDFRQVLEALIDGAIRGRDEQLAERVLDLWKGQTGVDVGAAAAGPLWQQAKLESWLGDLAWSRSLPDVAIVHFRRAIELESGNETARLKLAELLLQYGPEEAQTHLEFLRARKPDNRDVLLRLAACYRELGESERAAGVLDELLRLRAEDVLVLLERGRLALDDGKLQDAERWLRESERRAPGHREVLLSLSRCLQQAGRADEAENYRRMVETIDAGGIGGAAGGLSPGGSR